MRVLPPHLQWYGRTHAALPGVCHQGDLEARLLPVQLSLGADSSDIKSYQSNRL